MHWDISTSAKSNQNRKKKINSNICILTTIKIIYNITSVKPPPNPAVGTELKLSSNEHSVTRGKHQ